MSTPAGPLFEIVNVPVVKKGRKIKVPVCIRGSSNKSGYKDVKPKGKTKFQAFKLHLLAGGTESSPSGTSRAKGLHNTAREASIALATLKYEIMHGIRELEAPDPKFHLAYDEKRW